MRFLMFFYFVISIVFLSSCSKSQKNENENDVTVVSWGGKYQQSLFENWILPSAQKQKINVNGQSYAGEYKNITRMIKSDSVTWDLVQVETFFVAKAHDQNLLEPFSPPLEQKLVVSLEQKTKKLFPYAYPTIGWSYVLAWNEDILNARTKQSEKPKDWQDFWNQKKFPGKRALRDTPQGNIEIALLAKGYSKEFIYKNLYMNKDLSLVREALDYLNVIKGDIIWWSSGDQLQREIEAGRATLVAAWNGRVWLAMNKPIIKIGQSSKVGMTYNNAIMDYDWWMIPRGAKNPENASKLINEMYHNKEGAIAFAEDLGYGPPINNWEKHINKENKLLNFMPTTKSNMNKQFKIDPFFWAEYHEHISWEWEKWKAE